MDEKMKIELGECEFVENENNFPRPNSNLIEKEIKQEKINKEMTSNKVEEEETQKPVEKDVTNPVSTEFARVPPESKPVEKDVTNPVSTDVSEVQLRSSPVENENVPIRATDIARSNPVEKINMAPQATYNARNLGERNGVVEHALNIDGFQPGGNMTMKLWQKKQIMRNKRKLKKFMKTLKKQTPDSSSVAKAEVAPTMPPPTVQPQNKNRNNHKASSSSASTHPSNPSGWNPSSKRKLDETGFEDEDKQLSVIGDYLKLKGFYNRQRENVQKQWNVLKEAHMKDQMELKKWMEDMEREKVEKQKAFEARMDVRLKMLEFLAREVNCYLEGKHLEKHDGNEILQEKNI